VARTRTSAARRAPLVPVRGDRTAARTSPTQRYGLPAAGAATKGHGV